MKHWKNLLVCLLAGVLALGVLTACSGLGSVNTGTDAEKAAELAQQLGVSRTAIWKAVAALRADGIPVAAVTNRGYILSPAADVLNAAAVTALLARRLTRPLAVLTDAGAQIAAGDYARRTDLHTGDEIEALSRSFDKMADAVQEKIADLEADVQRREDFVGAFTHELKTPMTSIIGYADILAAMQTDPDEQREAAAAIAHEGRRLESLSHKLLALLGLAECPLTPAAVPLAALWPRLHAACPQF